MADHTSEPGAHHGGEGPERGPGMPRWVKIWGTFLLLALALLVLVAVLGGPGGHGPGRHASAAPAAAPVAAPAQGAQDPGRWL